MNCNVAINKTKIVCNTLGTPTVVAESESNVVVHIDPKTKEYLKSFLGDIDINWKSLGLNLDGSFIVVSLEKDEDDSEFISIKNMNFVYLESSNSDFGFVANIFPSQRTIFIDGLYLSKRAKGMGTKLMAAFLTECLKLKNKIDRVETIAIRRTPSDEKTKTKLNGYYFFPRIGFDASLDDVYEPTNLFAWKGFGERRAESKATRLLDYVYEDLEWWKEHGVPARCSFDLSTESKSWRILNEYLKSKK